MIVPDEITAARRALGRSLAAYREAAGYSQHALAPLVHYGRSTIANVEVGRQNAPRAFWQRCDEVLNASGALLEAYERLRVLIYQQQRAVARRAAWSYVETNDDAVLETRPRTRHGLLDADVAGHADRLLRLFLQLDATMGGDDLYEPMTRYVERVARATTEQPRPAALHGLSQLSQMAGWLALDSNRHGAARRYFTTAIQIAHEADNPSLAASSLAYLSLQETYRNNPKRAQALATTAVHVAGDCATPLVRTMLGTRLARVHAKLGNRAESLHALGDAAEAFARAGQSDEPLWISYVDAIELTAQSGACYLDLGMYADADAALTSAIEMLKTSRPERIRDHVHYLSRLAKCYLLAGDVEQACAIGMQAIDLVLAVGSSRVIERLDEFAVALAPVKAQAAREFRENFQLVKQSS